MADPLDVITLAEAESELGDLDDSLLAAYITRVSRLLDKVCGPIVVRTVTGEAHDGGSSMVMLKEWPVSSVTSVTEYQGTAAVSLTQETVSTSPSQGFVVDTDTGRLIRRSSKCDWTFYRGRNNIVVTYEAGRYATTAAVDARFKSAALITLRNLWSREQGMGTVTFGPDGQPITGATFALPNAAAAFIREDIRVTGHVD